MAPANSRPRTWHAACGGALLRRVRDFASFEEVACIDAQLADRALKRLDVDSRGLDALDHRYLKVMAEKFMGARRH